MKTHKHNFGQIKLFKLLPLKTQKDGPDSPNNVCTADDIQSKNLLNNTSKIRELNQQVASLQNVIIQVNILCCPVGGRQNKTRKVFHHFIQMKTGCSCHTRNYLFLSQKSSNQMLIFSSSGFIFVF